MHGAIAWRTKLLGWRGPYLLDDLGWHDRARENFETWIPNQNTDPIPAALPLADSKANLARNEPGLHSNGDLSNSHYDMNMVFIDALFRHLLWTGDTSFARKIWPVIERPGSARVTTAGAMDRSTQERFTEPSGDARCSTREPERCGYASGSRISKCSSTDESARNRCRHSTCLCADIGRCASLSTRQAGCQLSGIGPS